MHIGGRKMTFASLCGLHANKDKKPKGAAPLGTPRPVLAEIDILLHEMDEACMRITDQPLELGETLHTGHHGQET
jgi:hypothetical protein